MGSVRDVVALEHLLIGQALAVIADAPRLDGLKKGFAVVVLLLDKLAVVVEFVKRRGNGQQRGARQLEHGQNGFHEEVHRDVRGLIDDDNVTACAASGLRTKVSGRKLKLKSRQAWTMEGARSTTGLLGDMKEMQGSRSLVFFTWSQRLLQEEQGHPF